MKWLCECGAVFEHDDLKSVQECPECEVQFA